MQRLEVSGAVRPIYGSLSVKRLRNYRKQPYLILCKYFGKYYCKSAKYLSREIALHLSQILKTEQMQHDIPNKHGLFHVCSCNTLHKGYNNTKQQQHQ